MKVEHDYQYDEFCPLYGGECKGDKCTLHATQSHRDHEGPGEPETWVWHECGLNIIMHGIIALLREKD